MAKNSIIQYSTIFTAPQEYRLTVMIQFKKIQLLALSLLALVALCIGIKNVINPAFDFIDLKIALSALLVFFFNFGLNINLFLRSRCKTMYIWLPACIFNAVSLVLWLIMVWFDVSGMNDLFLKIAASATLLAFSFTNMTCLTLAQNNSIFTPVVNVCTRFICLLFSGFGVYFIIFANESELVIRTILILFLLLCYCNCMLAVIQLHERHLLKKKAELLLLKTATVGLYADRLGNLYHVTPASTDQDNLEAKTSAQNATNNGNDTLKPEAK